MAQSLSSLRKSLIGISKNVSLQLNSMIQTKYMTKQHSAFRILILTTFLVLFCTLVLPHVRILKDALMSKIFLFSKKKNNKRFI